MTQPDTNDSAGLVTFTTAADVPSTMSGHLDRFASDDDWDAACLAVWRAAEYRAGAYWIAKETADLIMDNAVERADGEQPDWVILMRYPEGATK